jgi:parallel beta-helix repeat protein
MIGEGKLLRIAVAASIAIVFSSVSFFAVLTETDSCPLRASISSYTYHAPISITSNSGFTGANGVTAGSGTASNPFVIEGWDIDRTESINQCGISISNTDSYFIIRGCNISGTNGLAGILIANCENGAFINNTLTGGTYGIKVDDSRALRAVNNTCVGPGIFYFICEDSAILNNSFSSGGLFSLEAIGVVCSHRVVVAGNNMTSGGIRLEGVTDVEDFNSHSIDASNKINGKPVFYCRNVSGFTCPSDAGQLLITNCSDAVIEHMDLVEAKQGIEISFSSNITVSHCQSNIKLSYSSNNTLENNSCFSDNWDGISLDASNSNRILDNNITNNLEGIGTLYSDDNQLCRNHIFSNAYNAMGLYYSDRNEIHDNVIEFNGASWAGIGIRIDAGSWNNITNNSIHDNAQVGIGISNGDASQNNSIHGNSISNNNGAGGGYIASKAQAQDDGENNEWDSQGRGNYWGDWTSPDNDLDGIVDIPYIIPGTAGAQDNFPLRRGLLTVASLSGTHGINGWRTSPVTVTLVASYPDGSVNATYYCIGTSGNWLKYTIPFLISKEGNFTVLFYSIDNASRSEMVRSVIFKIDSVAPILNIVTANNTEFSTDQVAIDFSASDATSGLYYFEFAFDGSDYFSNTSIANHTYTISGQVGGQLADGAHYVIIRFVDKAGNVNETRLDFKVHNTPSLVAGVPDLVLFSGIIIAMAAVLAAVLLMRKRKSPSMKLEDMKVEPPESS